MRKKYVLLIGVCAAAIPDLAFAQDTSVPAEAIDSAASDIVVTANRREQRLQDVPLAVTAMTGDALERSGINDTRQLTQAIPNLNFSRSNSAFQPTIRGIGTRGSSAGDESNIAVYIDGVYQPEMSALAFDLVNIERVEVLRGPQGTLFGRNSTGGLINVITPDPQYDTSGRAQIRYGRFNERSANFYVTTGVADNVAIDLAAILREDDGFIRDLVRGGHVGDRRAYAARSKILFEPSESSRFVLTASYSNVADNASVNSLPLNGNTSARSLARDPAIAITTKPWTSSLDHVRDIQHKQFSSSLEGKFSFGNFAVESTTAYQTNKVLVETDNDATSLDVARNRVDPRSKYFSEELRILSTGSGPLQWIGGAFVFSGTGRFDPITSTSNGTTNTFIYSKQDVTSYAGFSELNYEFVPDLILTAGLRFTHERREYNGRTERNGVVLAQISDAKTSFSEWTYRATLQKKFGPDANIYATYSRGFKSGVFNAFSTSPSSKPVRPEILDAFEVGLKSEPLPWLRANFSLFHYDYKDIQLSARDNTTALIVLLNAAQAKIDGAEIELSAKLWEGFSVSGYATYLDAKYSKFPGAQILTPIYQDQTSIGGSAMTPIGNAQSTGDVSGARMIAAPEYTFGINANYEVETDGGRFGISSNIFHSGKYYWDVSNRLVQPSYTMVNGELSWTVPGDKLRLSIWAKNLTNEKVFQQMLPNANADVVSYERPRTYGVGAQFNF